jgi:hypothetical protein
VLCERLEAITTGLDQDRGGAEAIFRARGITRVATYDLRPLPIEVGVLSSEYDCASAGEHART